MGNYNLYVPDVVSFSGKMGSGKDTYAKVFINHLSKVTDCKFVTYSFASSLKNEVSKFAKLLTDGISKEDIANALSVNNIDDVLYVITLLKIHIEKCNGIFDINNKTDELRTIFQFWGTKVRREQDPNYFVNKTKESIYNFILNEHKKVVITDARFLNELFMLRSINAYMYMLNTPIDIRMNRLMKRDGHIPSVEALTHPSETEFMTFYAFDRIIDTDIIDFSRFREIINQEILHKERR